MEAQTGTSLLAPLIFAVVIVLVLFMSWSWAKQGAAQERTRKINIMRDHASRITSLVHRYKFSFNNASELLHELNARHLWQKFYDPYTSYHGRPEDVAIVDVDHNGQAEPDAGINVRLLRSSLGLYRGGDGFCFFIYSNKGQIAHQTPIIEYPKIT
jgi:hypothetical protein